MQERKFVEHLGASIEKLIETFKEDKDYGSFEREIISVFYDSITPVITLIINNLLSSKDLMKDLKKIAASNGMRYKEHRLVSILLGTGKRIEVYSPYFVMRKKASNRKKKKQQKSGLLGHIGLVYLGFYSKCSENVVKKVVEQCGISPSFEVAKQLLGSQGLELNVKTLRKICRDIGDIGIANRGRISMEDTELEGIKNLSKCRLVIGIDGGRIRLRSSKRGAWKKGQKRAGYRTDWKEPKLFAMYLVDEQGNKVKDFSALYDGTVEKDKEIMQILEKYLRMLPLDQLGGIVFCGDGARWIFYGVIDLVKRLSDDKLLNISLVHQVIDYTHAQQALDEIIKLLPKSYSVQRKKRIKNKWKKLLWEGEIDLLQKEIKRYLKGKNRKKGLKKWLDYFKHNEHRMQYKHFKEQGIPCGSGCVESAIRRVLNLKLKGAGIFWKKQMAERFIFLRSQILTGRLSILMRNLKEVLLFSGNHAKTSNNLQCIHKKDSPLQNIA